jgi:hypothetical protein
MANFEKKIVNWLNYQLFQGLKLQENTNLLQMKTKNHETVMFNFSVELCF